LVRKRKKKKSTSEVVGACGVDDRDSENHWEESQVESEDDDVAR